jgi:hypothetical protein
MSIADFSRINYFARKWRWKFFDRYPDVGEGIFADECFALGFGMDSGKWFIETFPNDNIQSPCGLHTVIPQIDDVFFLGTAIFSYWRYQTHWAPCLLHHNQLWLYLKFHNSTLHIPPK